MPVLLSEPSEYIPAPLWSPNAAGPTRPLAAMTVKLPSSAKIPSKNLGVSEISSMVTWSKLPLSV